MNGIGPRNFNPNMKADLAKQVKDLGKLDEGKALGEAQQANTNNKPEGNTSTEDRVIKHGTGNLYDGFSVDGGLDPDTWNIVVLVDKDGTVTLASIFTDENGNITEISHDGISWDPDSDRT